MDAYNPRMPLKTRQPERLYPARAAIAYALALASVAIGCDQGSKASDASTPECDGGKCHVSPLHADAGSDASTEMMVSQDDAGTEASFPDSAIPEATDAGLPEDCRQDSDCNDQLYCNGKEQCLPRTPGSDIKTCMRAVLLPCADRACDERTHCDCSDPDRDGDNCPIPGCVKPGQHADCDDNDGARSPETTETCDPDADKKKYRDGAHHDEDCDPTTFGQRDVDGDGFVDARCANQDPRYGFLISGQDCDDDELGIGKGQEEICDGIDNDCDGRIDEVYGTPTGKRHTYYRDKDGDAHGDENEPLETLCNNPPPGYTYESDDCDDDDRLINPGREDICNGKDDDCLGGIDDPLVEGGLLFDEPFDGITDFECKGEDGWKVEHCPELRLDCNMNYHDACETRATSMNNCHACGKQCVFSCGEESCDEVAEISIGFGHACANTSEGNVACWGKNSDGQLANDLTYGASRPVIAKDIRGVRSIAAGYSHTCAVIGDDSTLYCWGSNAQTELGTGNTEAKSEFARPVRGVEGGSMTAVVSVALGAEHTCAIYGSGRLACWGLGSDGRLADGYTDEQSHAPQQAYRAAGNAEIQDARQVVAGYAHSCIVTTANSVECWGDNTGGQLGDDSMVPNAAYAIAVAGLPEVESLVAGDYFTCALAAGTVYCWGYNEDGQLGHESDESDDVPTPIAGLSDVKAIAAGSSFACALNTAGEVSCWGSNYGDERGEAEPGPTPERIVELPSVSALSAGGLNACAIADNQEALCWGENIYGQLGIGTTAPTLVPTPIKPLEPAP